MRYAQFDYHPVERLEQAGPMAAWWSSHWDGRRELKDDLEKEALWPVIEDILRAPGLVLEAGCGPGQWVQFLERRGHRVVGIDYALNALRIGNLANPDLRLLAADFLTLPFADQSFDYILSLGAVEHDVRGPEAALRELHRVLKPSGHLMCSVPCLNVERTVMLGWFAVRDWLKGCEILRRIAGKREPFSFYQYLFSPAEFRATLIKCGFDPLPLRKYGATAAGPTRRYLARLLAGTFGFYNPHMIMAVCGKRPSAERAPQAGASRRAERPRLPASRSDQQP
jgi:SAM-dependent methyltransferase